MNKERREAKLTTKKEQKYLTKSRPNKKNLTELFAWTVNEMREKALSGITDHVGAKCGSWKIKLTLGFELRGFYICYNNVKICLLMERENKRFAIFKESEIYLPKTRKKRIIEFFSKDFPNTESITVVSEAAWFYLICSDRAAEFPKIADGQHGHFHYKEQLLRFAKSLKETWEVEQWLQIDKRKESLRNLVTPELQYNEVYKREGMKTPTKLFQTIVDDQKLTGKTPLFSPADLNKFTDEEVELNPEEFYGYNNAEDFIFAWLMPLILN